MGDGCLLYTSISAMLVSNSILDTTEHDMLYSLKLIDYALDYSQNLDEQIDELNPLAYSCLLYTSRTQLQI